MNTTKIAAYYPYFRDVLKNLGNDPLGRTPAQCLEVKLQSDLVAGGQPTYRIEVTNRHDGTPRVDLLGITTTAEFEAFVPLRVLAWANRQLPTSAEDTGYDQPWRVLLSMRKLPDGQDSVRTFGCGTQEEVAVLLRGLRTYQQRLTRFAKKLASQLWVYHWQQESERVAHQQLVSVTQVTDTSLSCYDLTCDEFLRRTDAAEALEEQMQQKYNNTADYGREIMWHPLFPAEYVAVVSHTPLMEIAAWHENVDSWANQDRALDQVDYGYLADILRDALANEPTVQAAGRLRRALAVVGRTGATPLTGALFTGQAQVQEIAANSSTAGALAQAA